MMGGILRLLGFLFIIILNDKSQFIYVYSLKRTYKNVFLD